MAEQVVTKPTGFDPMQYAEKIRKFLNEKQDPVVVLRVYDQVITLCAEGETVKYIAVQKKPTVSWSVDSVVVTSRRLLIFHKVLIGMRFNDFRWQEIERVQLIEGLTGSTLTVRVGRKTTKVRFLPKKQARKLYQHAMEMKELVREDNSPRDTADSTQKSDDPAKRLRKLKEMLDEGLITQEESDAKRKQILDSM